MKPSEFQEWQEIVVSGLFQLLAFAGICVILVACVMAAMKEGRLLCP